MKIKEWDKTKTIRLIVASVIGVIILITMFWLSKSVYQSSNYYYPTEYFVQLENSKPVELNIQAPGTSPVLESVSVTFATNARSNEGNVRVELLEGGDVLTGWNINASELLDNAIRELKAPDGISLNEGGIYTIRITEEFEGENNIAVGAAMTGNLSCYLTTYDFSRAVKWFAVMSLIFTAGYIVLILKGGLLDSSIPKMILIGAVALLVMFIMEFDLFPRILTNLKVRPVPDSTGVWDTVEPGQSRNYTFSYQSGDLFEDLEIFTSGENASDYTVTLVNATTGRTYYADAPVSPDWRVSTGRLCMMLSSKNSAISARYYDYGDYELTVANISPDKAVNIELVSEPSEGEAGVIAFAGIRHTDLGVKVASFTIVMLYAMLIVLAFIRKTGRFTAERFFLVTVIPLSIFYLIVFQPWNVPDSGAHFLASYRISNLLLGINGRLSWFARACDADFYNSASWWTEAKPDLEGISMMIHGLTATAPNTGLIDGIPHEYKMEYYSFICWFPQALGLALGRLMHLGSNLTVLLGRLFILAAYIACCYRAVRNTPVGKMIFASLALLPVSLMMSSSFSYDSMVIISVLSFTAIVLKLRKAYSRGALIEALIWAFILGAVKGGSGLLVLPLVVILIKKDRKSLITLGAVTGTALLSVLLFDKILPSDQLFQFGEEGNGNMMTAFAYQNPVEYIRMLSRTYMYYADSFVNQAFGRELSYLETTVTTLTSAGAVIAALVYSTFEKDELQLRKSDRILFAAMSVLAFLIVPSMLLSYTPAGSGVIYGIQGRYFFQIMPVLLLAVTKFGLKESRIKCDEGTREASMRTSINVYMIFTVIMIYLMMKLYLTR